MLKKYIFLALFSLVSFLSMAQSKVPSDAPFLVHPTIANFDLRMLDSVSIANSLDIPKGKPTMIMIVSADCDHCEKMTQFILDSMAAFSHVQIVMGSVSTLALTKEFAKKLKLDTYKNIKIGLDEAMVLPGFYSTFSAPFIALYDSNKMLITTFKGSTKHEDITRIVRATK